MTERDTAPQDEILREEVRRYVASNIVPAKDESRCVDGRYPLDTEDTGKIAMPGGDFGIVMAIMAVNQQQHLGLTPEGIVDSVYYAVTSKGQPFSMHTDHHAHPMEESEHHGSKPLIGCGHIAKAADPVNEIDYGVNAADIQKALEAIKHRQAKGGQVRMVNLPGEHKEKAVLVVQGTKNTVNPHNGDMFFVYDATRAQNRLQEIVDRIGNPNLQVNDVQQAFDKQTGATLQRLALGKSIFGVNVDQYQPVVNLIGKVS